MASFLVVLLLAFPVFSLAPPEFSMQEMMKIFSEMTDENSISLTDSNYQEYLSNTTGPWFIFFHDSRVQKSVLGNPVWLIFGEEAQKENWEINFGRVDMSTEEGLRSHFRVSRPPTYLYIEGGYVYNYTGASEVEDFRRVFEQKTYLQYDRKPFSVHPPELTNILIFRRYFVQNPAIVIGGIFVAASILLRVPSWLSQKSDKKKIE